jgi:OOP family OmpA-OmpF porin
VFIIARKLTLSFIFISCAASTVSLAQSKSYIKIPTVGLHLTYIDFINTYKQSSFGRNLKPGIAINFQNNLSKQFDYSVTLVGSFLDFPASKTGSLSNGEKQLLLENDFSLLIRVLKSPAVFNPYIKAGAGWSQYNNHYGIYAPAGAGIQVNISPEIFLLFNTQYRLRITSLQHQHFYHSIGIAGAINRKKIPNAPPQRVQLPIIKTVQTDIDGDGIIDSLDACPNVAGVVRFQGCPVPDKDGDGIFDEDDLCPTVKGVIEYKGCPMPDIDMDGIADEKDKCPGMAGSAVNRGCPELETLKSWLNWMAQNIYFKTGSSQLLPRSFSSLESLASLLMKYPMVHLTIEGHTDNVGGITFNQTLSKDRATSVMDYLTRAGIQTSQLSAHGYGSNNPIADNKSIAGRANNRRVEFRISY